MAINLDKLSYDELAQLQKDVKRAIATFEDRRRKEALIEMQEVARRHGLDLSDVVKSARKGGPVSAPKFRHPENPELTWAGRGRQPRWIKEALESGQDIEKMRI
jgi:DNA-binding protein H-NS